ncbi:MAG TPA: hypothetical protein VF062_02670, partial [Candidatus Limnocylindrales bacterium]
MAGQCPTPGRYPATGTLLPRTRTAATRKPYPPRRPVIFYTNGYQHWIWDDAAFAAHGGYAPREIQGIYTRDELELLVQR